MSQNHWPQQLCLEFKNRVKIKGSKFKPILFYILFFSALFPTISSWAKESDIVEKKKRPSKDNPTYIESYSISDIELAIKKQLRGTASEIQVLEFLNQDPSLLNLNSNIFDGLISFFNFLAPRNTPKETQLAYKIRLKQISGPSEDRENGDPQEKNIVCDVKVKKTPNSGDPLKKQTWQISNCKNEKKNLPSDLNLTINLPADYYEEWYTEGQLRLPQISRGSGPKLYDKTNPETKAPETSSSQGKK